MGKRYLDETIYSDVIEGEERNYKWTVKFDLQGGYLGITLMEKDRVTERVLLSPKQVKALLEFVRNHK